jgi:hypothetical protein
LIDEVEAIQIVVTIEVQIVIIIIAAILDQVGLTINDHEVVVHQHVHHGLIVTINVLELILLVHHR